MQVPLPAAIRMLPNGLLLSGLARIQYNYKGKYMLTGAIRADGASLFWQTEPWGWFPSVLPDGV